MPSNHPKTPRFPTNGREFEEFDGRVEISDSKSKAGIPGSRKEGFGGRGGYFCLVGG